MLTMFPQDLLRRFDKLLPRIMYGKPVDLSTLPLPPGVGHQTHPVSAASVLLKGSSIDNEGSAKAEFGYVKRDLVRLLGVLSTGEKVVQDRVRACGGIPVVMNLCVVDERNPCESPKVYVYSDLPPSRRKAPHCCASHPFIWTPWYSLGIDTL